MTVTEDGGIIVCPGCRACGAHITEGEDECWCEFEVMEMPNGSLLIIHEDTRRKEGE